MDTRTLSIADSNAIVSFGQHQYGESTSNRYLAIHGAEVFDLGYPCPSCTTLFARVDSKALPMSPHEVSYALSSGVSLGDDDLIAALRQALPPGEYTAAILPVRPRLCRPGSSDDYFANEYELTTNRSHDPRTDYYRGRSIHFPGVIHAGAEEAFHELAVPLYPPSACDPATVSDWERRLNANERPSALAISVLDVVALSWFGEEGFEPDPRGHWVLTHYLLDGHHKMLAAANTGKPMDILSFLKHGQGAGHVMWSERLHGLLDQFAKVQ